MKTLFGFCLLLFFAFPRGAWADARSQARRFFQQGFVLLEKGQLDDAIRSFISANKILPHPDVQFNIARACADAKRYTDAIAWYERYLNQSPPPEDSIEIKTLITGLRGVTVASNIMQAETLLGSAVYFTPPASIQDDINKLNQTAKDLEALSPRRAQELKNIASKYTQIAKLQGAITRPAPKTRSAKTETKTDQGSKEIKRASPALRRDARKVKDYEEQEIVTAATGEAAAPFDAPAVVWVLTQQDIRHRGYESIAEVLQNVAGLHVIDNFVYVDVGVRGVHEGLRGQTRLIKVLIDGHALSFRPSRGNFLGLEMIPIRAVDRIELLRGPASALYGANAFSGVLQIITRRGGDIRGGSLGTRVGTNLQSSASAYSSGGDIILGTRSGRVSMFFAGSMARIDRSGLALPETSPIYDGDQFSQNDLSRPLSIFSRITMQFDKTTALSLDGGLQRLDSSAEWLDTAVLTGFNRVALQNLWMRLSFDTQFDQDLSFNAYAAYINGTTPSENRYRPLRTGAKSVDTSSHIEETVASRTFNLKAELSWNVSPRIRLRFGGDFEADFEELSVAEIVFTEPVGVYRAGDRASIGEAQAQPEQVFANSGFYTQIEASPFEWLDAIGGLRFDYHNRDKAAVNGRLGTVFHLVKGTTLKLLYGSSFKAPSPDQLFHQATYIGDTIGCENFAPCSATRLRPQIAHTGELVLGYSYDENTRLQVTGYLSYVDELILSFPTQGGLFVTTNAGTYFSKGIETEFTWRVPASKPDHIQAMIVAYFSFQQTEADIPESLFKPPETIRREFREQSLFPGLSGGFGLDLALEAIHLGVYTEGRFVGERRASGSNLALGEYENGSLPSYFELDSHISTRDLYLLEQKETVFSLSMKNITGAKGAEGGFRGWDIPRMGRSLFFRVIQEF